MQQRIIPDLELRLRRRCETLVGFHRSSPNSSSSKTLVYNCYPFVLLFANLVVPPVFLCTMPVCLVHMICILYCRLQRYLGYKTIVSFSLSGCESLRWGVSDKGSSSPLIQILCVQWCKVQDLMGVCEMVFICLFLCLPQLRHPCTFASRMHLT